MYDVPEGMERVHELKVKFSKNNSRKLLWCGEKGVQIKKTHRYSNRHDQ